MAKKIGIALGAGGARGLAHIGVLKALQEHDIKIDCIAGTSAGALFGGLYACLGLEKLEELANELNYRDLLSTFSDPFSPTGLFKGQRVVEYLKRYVGDVKIEDLPVNFAAVATDIKTGRAEVIDKGDLCTAIRASSSIPVVFEPVNIGNKYYCC